VVEALPHVSGWSAKAWQIVAEAAALGKVACDASGTRLLLGGREDASGRPLEEARLWDLAADKVQVGQQAGAGPVAFRREGKPVTLVTRKGPSLLLWDLAGQQSLGECRFHPAPGQDAPSGLIRNELGLPVLALTRGARSLALTGWLLE
jgi:hypothetical protein